MYILNKDFQNTKFIVSEKVSTHFNEDFQSYEVTSADHAQKIIVFSRLGFFLVVFIVIMEAHAVIVGCCFTSLVKFVMNRSCHEMYIVN